MNDNGIIAEMKNSMNIQAINEIDEKIKGITYQISIKSEKSLDFPVLLSILGNLHIDRFKLTNQLSDINEGLRIHERAVKISRKHSEYPRLLNNLGIAFRERYNINKEMSDLLQSIEIWRKALKKTNDKATKSRLFSNIGTASLDLYTLTSDKLLLDESISSLQNAIDLLSTNSPVRSRILYNLGNGLKHRYLLNNNISDLEEGIKKLQESVNLLPINSSDNAKINNLLGRLLHDLYKINGDLATLNQAIECWRKTVKGSHKEHPEFLNRLTNLYDGLRDLYLINGDFSVLEESISIAHEVLRQTEKDSPDIGSRLNNLGLILHDRFSATGNISDIEESIDFCQKSINASNKDDPYLPSRYNNLGSCYYDYFSFTRNITFLDKAIENFERADSLTPPASREKSIRLNNIGSAFVERFLILGTTPDLEKAIQYHEDALTHLIDKYSTKASILNNLADELRYRYKVTKNITDLQRALGYFQQAESILPENSIDLPCLLINLSRGLAELSESSGKIEYLNQAIEKNRKAIDLTPEESPDLPIRLINLGELLRIHYAFSSNTSDLDESFNLCNEARLKLNRSFYLYSVPFKIGQRIGWGNVERRCVDITLLLSQIGPIEKRSYYKKMAFVCAEGAKSRLLNEFLNSGNIPPPISIPYEIIQKENELVKQIHQINLYEFQKITEVVNFDEKSQVLKVLQEKKRNQLIKDLNLIWKQIETFPDGKKYISTRKGEQISWEDIKRIAGNLTQETAIISLFITESAFIFFVVRADWEIPEIINIPFNEKTQQKIWISFQNEIHKYNSSKNEDWFISFIPFFQMIASYCQDAKRVVFVPYGIGHLLPWFVVAKKSGIDLPWITLPTLGILLHSSQLEKFDKLALVIGNPTEDLIFAEREAIEVGKMLGIQPILRRDAIKRNILGKVSSVRVIHFATHAFFDKTNPFNSGIRVADDVITVTDLNNSRIRSELVVLSACETGIMGSIGGDEMIGLIHALLLAGVKSILVSLWSIDDNATALLMKSFYQKLINEGLLKAESLNQAMNETQKFYPHHYFWGSFILIDSEPLIS